MDGPVGLLGVIGRWKGVTYQVGGLYSIGLVSWIGFCLGDSCTIFCRRKGAKEECRGVIGEEAHIAANNKESQAINGVTSCDL